MIRIFGASLITVGLLNSFAFAAVDESCPDFSGDYVCTKVKKSKDANTVTSTVHITQYKLENESQTTIVMQQDQDEVMPIGLVLDEQYYVESNDESFAISRRSSCKKKQLVTERVILTKEQEDKKPVYPTFKSTMICELNKKKNMECSFVMKMQHYTGATEQESYSQTCTRLK